jgi:hypothetical protein
MCPCCESEAALWKVQSSKAASTEVLLAANVLLAASAAHVVGDDVGWGVGDGVGLI